MITKLQFQDLENNPENPENTKNSANGPGKNFDIRKNVQNTENTLEILEKYSGNPKTFFPKNRIPDAKSLFLTMIPWCFN